MADWHLAATLGLGLRVRRAGDASAPRKPLRDVVGRGYSWHPRRKPGPHARSCALRAPRCSISGSQHLRQTRSTEGDDGPGRTRPPQREDEGEVEGRTEGNRARERERRRGTKGQDTVLRAAKPRRQRSRPARAMSRAARCGSAPARSRPGGATHAHNDAGGAEGVLGRKACHAATPDRNADMAEAPKTARTTGCEGAPYLSDFKVTCCTVPSRSARDSLCALACITESLA